MDFSELEKCLFTEKNLPQLNRNHIVCAVDEFQSFIDDAKTSVTVKLATVFDIEMFDCDIKEIIEALENDEHESARKRLRKLEKEPNSEYVELTINLLKLYADAALWSANPEERYKTRFEDTYAMLQVKLDQHLDAGVVDQFKQNAIRLIRDM